MIVKVRNINTFRSFQVEGEFETLSDLRRSIEGTENEQILSYNARIVNITNDRERVEEHTNINTSDNVELLVYPGKLDAGI
jgi:molybdopterin converting factor small subunit